MHESALLEAVENLTDEIRLLREDLRPELKQTAMMQHQKLLHQNCLESLKSRRKLLNGCQK